ncbi:TPA: PAS domain S-box protein [Candidatus Wolfebacteria bacterium]|uniref:PAS domain S-box n=1 Tax=Candidatus Wolfebacteria bacterium GW2011_GWB1_47_1 TaxID=1619007 RepID=A0A0G4ARW2_9BACT|nr:MAG: PAS domain S-box [Candidatus Wolfebacteria bacterium GW2011_GWB1_47_1]HAL24659.1 PAS domain S-box protein [Candidatus Wolfebacteria bacterium]HBD17763.1 PAS domain S-box protein [Candidatus Wolfebacteria bacterium]HBN87334.1 PAS domain S-box protein [Candidatus Wolfebacteria bacterium]HCM53158.1 PAS domain S-box protein [Candidatus Wolfebacteria bacterium]
MAMDNQIQKDESDQHQMIQKQEAIRLGFFESMDQVNRAIQGASDLEQMLGGVLEKVFSIFNCDRAWLLYPCDPDAASFRVPMEVTRPEYPGAKILNVDVPMNPDVAQNMREALVSPEPVVYIAGTDRPINKVTAEQFGVQSQIFTPVYPKEGKPWIFGMHQCSFPRVWTEEEQQLFQEISRRLADGLTSLLAYRDIQEKERYFRALFYNMLTGLAHCEMIFNDQGAPVDFRYLDVNPVFEKLTGLKDVVGKLVSEVIPGIKESDPKLFEIYGRVASGGEPEQFEIYLEALKIWFSISVFSMQKGFFTAVFDNITEQKNRELQLSKAMNELKNVVDALPSIIYVLDTKSNLIKWNRRAEIATGYSANELKQKLSLELIADHDQPSFIGAINDAYDKEYVEVDAHLVRKDGSKLPYRWSAAPMRDAHGADIGIIGIGWDLTDQIKSAAKIAAYQEQQRVILDSVPDIIWMKDVNGVYLSVNEAYLSRIGKQREEIIGKTDLDLWPKEFADKYRADDKKVTESGLQKRMEETAPDLNGNIIWVETIKIPVYDDAGLLRGIAGVARDITEQKQIREALEKQELINTVVSNNLPIGYAINTISDGKAIFINKKFEEIYGWPRETLTSVDAFFEHVYPNPEFRKKIKEQVTIDIMSGDPVRMVWEKLPIVRQSGETAYITARNIPLTEYDLMVSTVLDVTHQVKVEKALRESEGLQRSILNTMPELVFVKDTEGRYITANKAWLAFVHKELDEIIGKTDPAIFPKEYADTYRADDEAVIKTGSTKRIEEASVDGAGVTAWFETTKAPFYNDENTIVGIVGIARDITSQKSQQQ